VISHAGSKESQQLATLMANPEVLLDEIDRALEQVPVESLPPAAPSGAHTLRSESPPAREVRDGRPRHRVLDAILDSVADTLHEAICVRGDYCRLRARLGPTVDLAKAVMDSWLGTVTKIPLPLATVTAYCIQSLFLDRLCGCAS